VTAGLTLREYLAARRELVDQALERFLPAPPRCPAVVSEAMRYSLFAGGKRFRPILALAAAEAVAADIGLQEGSEPRTCREDPVALALPAACAIELIHTYSLVHDDLPAMDNDTLRRGRPTSHVVHGEGMAILAGDGLLTEAFALLAREPADRDGRLAPRIRRTIGLIADAAGAAGMVGGQALDLQAAGKGPEAFSLEGLRDMHARKTGALIKASALAGAVMAGGSREAVDAVGRYGAHLGLAFQIVDDVLDVEGATEELGKTAGKDAAAGKPTYPALLGLERSKTLAAETFAAALDALDGLGVRSSRLEEIARWVVGRTS
jgi:geranylgeranyl diphosphate synthase type II